MFGRLSEVIGSHRKSSEVVGHHRRWSEVVGSCRKLSEVVGSIKEGHMSNYYITVKSELICVISQTCGREKVSLRSAHVQARTHAQ